MYSWGRGTFGRLGTGSEDDQLFPVPLDFFDSVSNGGAVGENRLKIMGIAAGAYHSLALAGSLLFSPLLFLLIVAYD